MIFKRILKIILVLVFIALIGGLGILGMSSYVAHVGAKYITTINQAENADCIIVLGAEVVGNSVSETLGKRLDTAYEVYKAGKAPKIIVSGDHGRTEYNEVGVMRQYLMDKGVPKENIFMDHAGFNTYDTMYRARDIFVAKNAIIVTQREHLLRSLYITKKLGMKAVGIESANYDDWEIKYQKPREFLARIKAFLQCELLHPKPKFLGEVIPVTGSGVLTED